MTNSEPLTDVPARASVAEVSAAEMSTAGVLSADVSSTEVSPQELMRRRDDSPRPVAKTWAICTLLALVGLIVTPVSIGMLIEATASWSWQPVRGRITETSTGTRTELSGRDRRETTVYVPELTYVWYVGGQRHRGHRWTYHGMPSFEHYAAAAAWVSQFDRRRERTIYYDPAAPDERSCLRPGPRPTDWLMLLPGPVCLLAAGMYWRTGRGDGDGPPGEEAVEPLAAAA